MTKPGAGPADGAVSVGHELRIQLSRAVFFNGAWFIGLVAKLLGFLSFSWAAAIVFLALANLNILVFSVLYGRGIGRVGGVSLRACWMAFDLVIITWVIAASGGSESVLYPWYLTNVAAAAFYAGRRGLLVVMVADILAYLLVVGLTEGFEGGLMLAVLARMLILFGGAGYALLAIFRLQEKRRVIGELQAAQLRRADELEAAIATIASSAVRLAAAAEDLETVSRSMTDGAEDTAVQAGAVSASVERVSAHVHTVAAAVEELSCGVREIARLAREAAEVAAEAVGVADGASATIAKLDASSSEIAGIVSTITAIADQTRLLALNATIEAARAGDAGRGFAVVAAEVKELAGETAAATEEIGAKVAAIQADAGAVVGAIGRIGGIVARVNDLQTTIAGAVEQQTATTAEIASSVADAARGGSEIAGSIAAVAAAAARTSAGATAVEQQARDLAAMAEELEAGSPGDPVQLPAGDCGAMAMKVGSRALPG